MRESDKIKRMKPLVTIICISYNQEKYIRQTIEGFLMQRVNFEYEIIIHDDASTDGTKKIIQEYIDKNPNKFRPVLQTENQYSESGVKFLKDLYMMAEGKYIAVCEGDDYWTDPTKLQKQVDFLEKEKDYVMVFHPVNVIYQNGEEPDSIFPKSSNRSDFKLINLLKTNFIHTNSMLYRRQNYDSINSSAMPIDWYLHLFHAQFGKIGFINEVMAVYRKHDAGIWWNSSREDRAIFFTKYIDGHMNLFLSMIDIYGSKKKYKDTIYQTAGTILKDAIDLNRENKNFVKELVEKYTQFLPVVLIDTFSEITKRDEIIIELNLEMATLHSNLTQLTHENRSIIGSLSFKVGRYAMSGPRLLRQLKSSLITKFKELSYLNRIKISRKVHKDRGVNLAVVIHVYHTDLWSYMHDRLENIKIPYDLFITLPEEKADFGDTIARDHPGVYIVTVPNRGRDVLPFLQISKIIIKYKYKYILKLHTKKSLHRNDGAEWFQDIYEKLIPSDHKVIKDVISVLEKRNTSIVGPEGSYTSLDMYLNDNKEIVLAELKKYISESEANAVLGHAKEYGFFAGTMFWCRSDSILDIVNTSDKPLEFPLEEGQYDGTKAHALERLFGVLPQIQHKVIYSISTNAVKKIDQISESDKNNWIKYS